MTAAGCGSGRGAAPTWLDGSPNWLRWPGHCRPTPPSTASSSSSTPRGGSTSTGCDRRGFGQAAPGRLVFVAFDVLALRGAELIARRWDTRRALLVDLGLDGPAWCTTPSYPDEGAALFEATRAAGIEGVVAKRLDAPYRPGVRTKAWVKTKHFDRAWFDVVGVTPTREERYALLLGAEPAGYVGRVEWGFTRHRLEELITRGGRPT